MALTVHSLAAVKSGHAKFALALRNAVEIESETASDLQMRWVQEKHKFKTRTGHLIEATKSNVIRTKSGALIKLNNRLPYAESIDKGAKPHVIEAKKAPFLVFQTRDGKWVKRKKVNHPGNRPYRFMSRAHLASGRGLERGLRRRMGALASGF